MKKFLMFDFMVTPWIIRILYWILQFFVIVFGVLAIFGAASIEALEDMGVLGGIALIIARTLFLRLFFEMLMVQFKISENTSQLKDIMKKD